MCSPKSLRFIKNHTFARVSSRLLHKNLRNFFRRHLPRRPRLSERDLISKLSPPKCTFFLFLSFSFLCSSSSSCSVSSSSSFFFSRRIYVPSLWICDRWHRQEGLIQFVELVSAAECEFARAPCNVGIKGYKKGLKMAKDIVARPLRRDSDRPGSVKILLSAWKCFEETSYAQ